MHFMFILNPQKYLPTVVTTLLSRYALCLAMLDYNIIHIKGMHKLQADALSLGSLDDPKPIITPAPTYELMCLAISSAISSDNVLLTAVKEDSSFRFAIQATRTGDCSKVTEDS
ncbi:unnamed protein product [Lepeophtheirus salmonis]|uniref:(salmon louse) hypothetical protein n=1 Tax=Lepeophtheirus salmonis TaxID=72036 RepID=A0A7R8D188_LEPSM|nr:unnamed protein product [Lepeophtheirus salmonis]CAF2993499.1 unnamed protein product [Lepeophtheirus salmonis]